MNVLGLRFKVQGFSWKSAIFPLITLYLAPCTLNSCNTSGCTEERSSVPLAKFCSSANGLDIALDSVTVCGVDAPNDSAMLKAGRKATEVYLPLRSTKTSTSFCFRYEWEYLNNPALYDTLTFDYTSEPFFASDECGAMFRYNIKRVGYTTHLIDSVAVRDSLVTNASVPGIYIYFRTNEEE